MCDYDASSQQKYWLYSPEQLETCRQRANRLAREFLSANDSSKTPSPPVHSFAAGFAHRKDDTTITNDTTSNGSLYLTPHEEELLVAFYASKLPSLIGPMAQVPRLRRDIKVAATSALLFRRFFLSNSVMLFDPKAVMVAAAFLGSKVEDATADARYLEEGTKLMNSPVQMAEILAAELSLIEGINFDLLCFHPYKAVLAFTEDLRTYLKTEKGKLLATFPTSNNNTHRVVSGQDLKPMHDGARTLLGDVIVSDIPLLYSPGQVGLAALMVTNDELLQHSAMSIPKIDFYGYMEQRFDTTTNSKEMRGTLKNLCDMLVGLREGKYGCGNHNVDLQQLKGVHKKLKKCRIWGKKSSKKRKQSMETDKGTTKRAKTK